MGKLDSLKIDDSPLAFASFAAKHNALVDLLAGMVGQSGIEIVMAEKNAIIRANIAAGPAGPAGNVAGNTANVVGFNGLLQNVYVGNAIPNAYPERLEVRGVSNARVTINFDEVAALNAASTQYVAFGSNYFYFDAGTYSMTLDAADITRNMSVREIDVCSGNVAMKMLVIASAPY